MPLKPIGEISDVKTFGTNPYEKTSDFVRGFVFNQAQRLK